MSVPQILLRICIICSKTGVSALPELHCCQPFENYFSYKNYLDFQLTFLKIVMVSKMLDRARDGNASHRILCPTLKKKEKI